MKQKRSVEKFRKITTTIIIIIKLNNNNGETSGGGEEVKKWKKTRTLRLRECNECVTIT